MTEYHTMNGSSNGHAHFQNYAEQDSTTNLEESIISLLSTESLILPDENKTAKSLYRKCAKLFINKKFEESYRHVQQLADVSLSLVDQGKIDEELFVNIWSLYFNLIDMILNKGQEQVSKQQVDDMETALLSDAFFDSLYDLNFIVNPKLILLLTLIKLNNDKTDLERLRQKVDLYFVNASTVFHEGELSYESFTELLEVYHVHLLVKLGEVEESEFLIKSNPHIKDPEGMTEKMKSAVKDLENEKSRKADAQRKKELAAQKRREQRANERAKEKLFKDIEKAKQTSIDEQKQEKREVVKAKNESLTVLDVIKKRFEVLSNRSALVLIFSLLSFIVFAQNNRFLFNGHVRQLFSRFWNKLTATAQMALKVTYM